MKIVVVRNALLIFAILCVPTVLHAMKRSDNSNFDQSVHNFIVPSSDSCKNQVTPDFWVTLHDATVQVSSCMTEVSEYFKKLVTTSVGHDGGSGGKENPYDLSGSPVDSNTLKNICICANVANVAQLKKALPHTPKDIHKFICAYDFLQMRRESGQADAAVLDVLREGYFTSWTQYSKDYNQLHYLWQQAQPLPSAYDETTKKLINHFLDEFGKNLVLPFVHFVGDKAYLSDKYESRCEHLLPDQKIHSCITHLAICGDMLEPVILYSRENKHLKYKRIIVDDNLHVKGQTRGKRIDNVYYCKYKNVEQMGEIVDDPSGGTWRRYFAEKPYFAAFIEKPVWLTVQCDSQEVPIRDFNIIQSSKVYISNKDGSQKEILLEGQPNRLELNSYDSRIYVQGVFSQDSTLFAYACPFEYQVKIHNEDIVTSKHDICIFNVNNFPQGKPTLSMILKGLKNHVSHLIFNSNSTGLVAVSVSLSKENVIAFWDLRNDSTKPKYQFNANNVTAIALNSDDRILAVTATNSVILYDLQQGINIKTIVMDKTPALICDSLVFNPDLSKIIFSGRIDQQPFMGKIYAVVDLSEFKDISLPCAVMLSRIGAFKKLFPYDSIPEIDLNIFATLSPTLQQTVNTFFKDNPINC